MELDRANASQDRQIYPEIQPGPEVGTTTLLLKVKDRLPLHGKVELNNQSTPATPELRVNTSVFYNNLWDREHSIGFQYGFTPESFKDSTRLPERFYDSPLIANYSAYYRLPLKSASSVTEEIANSGGSFGYNEVTRQFRLPPASGRPEFNFYVARSTSDTDVKFGPKIVTAPSTISTVYSQDSGRDLTLTENLGFRYTQPVPEIAHVRSTISAGFDFKFYRLRSFNTNNFLTVSVIPSDDPSKPPEVIQGVASQAQPTRVSSVAYVPFALRWDADRPDASGTTSLGLGYTANFVLGPNAGANEFGRVAGSSKSTGKFITVNGTLSREQRIYEDWLALLRLDGQWANEPLVSNEQFGIGGTAGVRGYREGERYGDLGWRVTFEPHTPMIDVGMVDGTEPMRARVSVFLDYGESYLSDPQGRAGHVSLLGTGFGVMATIGHMFDLRLTFAWPLLDTAGVRAGNGRIYFGVGAQF